MASSRILIICSFSLLITFWGCGSSKEAVKSESDETASNVSAEENDSKEVLLTSLNYDRVRPSLADGYRTLSNEVPTHFLPKDEKGEPIITNDGFRIQILSTASRDKAEKATTKFNNWVFQSEGIEYKANTYIIFKQPYFRVHIGDFKNRSAALSYNKQVKKLFPDSWIVRDDIDLERTPQQKSSSSEGQN
jgi:hypothetical protein